MRETGSVGKWDDGLLKKGGERGPGTQAPKENLVPLPGRKARHPGRAEPSPSVTAAREGRAAMSFVGHKGPELIGRNESKHDHWGDAFGRSFLPIERSRGTRWLRSNWPGHGFPDPEFAQLRHFGAIGIEMVVPLEDCAGASRNEAVA